MKLWTRKQRKKAAIEVPELEALDRVHAALAEAEAAQAYVVEAFQRCEMERNTAYAENDDLRQEAERLRADAAYGRTAMDSYVVVQRERDDERERAELLHGLMQERVNETAARMSPHIQELEARVAHLEGALREIAGLSDMENTYQGAVLTARRALTASPTMTPPSECQEFEGVGFMHRSGNPGDNGWTPCPTNGVHISVDDPFYGGLNRG